MCGISGIVNQLNEQVEKKDISVITDLISHRGPDAEGFYFSKNLALGHRRLSILDLSSDGNQPMLFDDKYIIVFNGEIYNYLEIKEFLIEKGYCFKSKTDTEVILASYDYWGEECVNQFNGMWSFCIYDKIQNILFCSRDRYGIKPFYYSVIENKFIFGSEIKQLLHFHSLKYVNSKTLIEFICGYEEHNTTETFFENIYKLAPSHSLIYNLNNHQFYIKRYYELTIDNRIGKLNEQEVVALIEKEFERSVNIRLRSDVKVGTCLSGGLDSSTITSYASKLYKDSKQKFTAIHAKSIEERTDESMFAKIVAEQCDCDLKIVEPSTNLFLEVLDKVIKIHEEPFSGPSLYMQYFVFEKARENNCFVMLDGQGGDEVFLGYERYYLPTLKYLSLKKKILLLRSMKKFTNMKYKTILASLLSYNMNFIYSFLIKLRYNYIKNSYFKLINSRMLKNYVSGYKDINQLQKNELQEFVLPHLLKVEDKNSMYHSIESRLPFLDYKLIETVFSVNNSLKVKDMWTKYLMRKMISSKLPDEIVWRRKKLGFAAPVSTWLKNKEMFMKEIQQSEILRTTLSYVPKVMSDKTMWKLYNIARWERLFDVKIHKLEKS